MAFVLFSAKQTSGRILAMWFPVMILCLSDYNTLSPICLLFRRDFAGANVTWSQFFQYDSCLLGNVTGAAFVGASYLMPIVTY